MYRSNNRVPGALAVAMLSAAILAWALTPKTPSEARSGGELAQLIPRRFGDWREVPTTNDAVDPRSEQELSRTTDSPYDDVLMRSYVNGQGEVVLLAIAYGRVQRQEIKVHRPELCYVAQGFEIVQHSPVELPIERSAVSASRMVAVEPGRTDLVSYWIRIGDRYGDNAWSARYHMFMQALKGRSVDGVVVRVSQTLAGPDNDLVLADLYRTQESLLADLVRSLPTEARVMLLGRQTANTS